MFLRILTALGLAASLSAALVTHNPFHNATTPATPVVAPPPHGGTFASKTIQLSWAEPGSAPVAGFAYAVDQQASSQPPHDLMTSSHSANIDVPSDGDWYFHVSAVDDADHWSPTATIEFHVDSRPLTLGDLSASGQSFNPAYDVFTVKSTISKTANLQATIVSAENGKTVRNLTTSGTGNQLQWQWDGKTDQGRPAPEGDYQFIVRASDDAGNEATKTSAFTLTNKRIVVSLSQQVLSAYDGDRLDLRTLVTTGGPELPTPKGLFHVLGKYTNLPVYSPWPEGSPYWFEPVTYTYAMDFFENDQYGLYIHDASWRHEYGPGSNVQDGTPGTDTTGTHGCINVPLEQQEALYNWSMSGVPVIIKD